MAETKTTLATGRRKSAVARVRLAPGNGKITVNGRAFEHYFPTESLRGVVSRPLALTDNAAKFDVCVTVSGGGPDGQAGAVRHGIARALQLAEPTLRAPLKVDGLLTRDSRQKERKKYGQPGARKRYQFSKR